MKIAFSSLLLFCSLLGAGQQTSIPSPPLPGKLIDIGGYRLHLNCTGKKGPTVVLIAGAGDFSFDWSLVQPRIGQFARVCSYDRPGFAWSDPGPTPHTMKQEAFELHTLLNAAHINGPYVGKLIVAANSGHHIQLDEPQVVIDAVRMVVESSRQHRALQ